MPHCRGWNWGFYLRIICKKNAFPPYLIIEGGTRDFNSNFRHEKNSLTRNVTLNFSRKEELVNKGFHLELLHYRGGLINHIYKNGWESTETPSQWEQLWSSPFDSWAKLPLKLKYLPLNIISLYIVLSKQHPHARNHISFFLVEPYNQER